MLQMGQPADKLFSVQTVESRVNQAYPSSRQKLAAAYPTNPKGINDPAHGDTIDKERIVFIELCRHRRKLLEPTAS